MAAKTSSANPPKNITGALRRPGKVGQLSSLFMSRARRSIARGDVFWIPADETRQQRQSARHPHVVVQVLEVDSEPMVIVCAITTNIKRAKHPGNILLEACEANLPRSSVVIVSKVLTVEPTLLGEYVGSLSPARIDQITAGMHFVQTFAEAHQTRAG